jgi:hypothetical protein
MKFAQYILILVVVGTLSSCERTADIELPEVDPKIVLTSFIGPELTNIQAVVRYSSPVFGEENDSDIGDFETEPDMIVTISNGTITDTLEMSDELYTYALSTTEFPIVAGATYTMTVTSPSGEKVSATTTVPSIPASILSGTVEFDSIPNSYGYDYYGDLKMTLADVSDGFNYYRLVYYAEYGGSGFSYWGEDYVNDDNLSDGKVNRETRLYYYSSGSQVSATAFVMNCSEEYYRFHWSLNNFNGDSPFSEPAIIYSNVEGGLGCFGGYNKVLFDLN